MAVSTLSYLPSEQGFLGLPAEEAGHLGAAKAVIVPFGLEASVSYGSGTANGPEAILQASHQVELFDEEYWCEPYKSYGIATLHPSSISKDLPQALEQLETTVTALLQNSHFPLVLGGEHSLTVGSIRPFAKHYPNLTVLHIDAHADLRNSYNNESFSHACAMRRVLDHKNINVISIGVRSISSAEIAFFEGNTNRIAINWAKDKHNWDLADTLAPLKNQPFYLSFDIDAFDSSLMPATGTPEPGGLFFNEALDIVRTACIFGTCVGADVVELAPLEGHHASDFLAAKLTYKILTYALSPDTNTLK